MSKVRIRAETKTGKAYTKYVSGRMSELERRMQALAELLVIDYTNNPTFLDETVDQFKKLLEERDMWQGRINTIVYMEYLKK